MRILYHSRRLPSSSGGRGDPKNKRNPIRQHNAPANESGDTASVSHPSSAEESPTIRPKRPEPVSPCNATIPQPAKVVKFGRARRPLKINETPSGSTKPGVTAQGGVTVGPDGTSESVGASGSSSALANETATPYDSNDNIPDATPEVNTENAGPRPLPGLERLYMTAATAKRKAGVVENTIDPNGRARSLLPASEYKIADIFANVNPADAAEIKTDGVGAYFARKVL